MEQYNCVLGFLSLLILLILIATNTLSETIFKQIGTHKKDRTFQNNILTIEKYVRYLLKVQSLHFTQQIWFIQYLSWFHCIPKLKYKRGNYRCCVVLLLLLLAVLLSAYVLLLYTRKINPWIIENLVPVTSVWTVALYVTCLLPEKMVSNRLKCTMASTSTDQSPERIQSLSEQS